MLQMSLQDLLQTIVFPVLGGVIWYFREQISQLTKTIGEIEAASKHTNNNISQWQLQIVQNYVTKVELERLEQRILSALDRMTNKLEKAMDRPHARDLD